VIVGALTPSSTSVPGSFSFVPRSDTASGLSSLMFGLDVSLLGGDIFGEVATLVLHTSASSHPGIAMSQRLTYRSVNTDKNRPDDLYTK